MTMNDDDWVHLNALADGELPQADADALTAKMADDSELRAAYDEIVMVKNALKAARPAALATDEPVQRPRRKVVTPLRAIAASVLVAGLLLGTNHYIGGTSQPHIALADIHGSFSDMEYDLGAAPAVQPAGLSQGPLGIDLSASNLTLVDTYEVTVSDGYRTAAHYRGRNGCRVTLFRDSLPTSLEADIASFGLTSSWSTKLHRYTVVATGMDTERFHAIAAFAEFATQRRDTSPELHAALTEATRYAHPCA